MFSISYRFAADTGIGLVGIFYGIGIAILTFVWVVYVEARVMKKYFDFSNRKRYGYSTAINLISTIIGLRVVFYLVYDLVLNIVYVIILSIILTIIIEYFSFLLIARMGSAYKKAFFFIVKSNLLSYLAMLIFPIATVFLITFLIAVFSV